jgi:outer membrane autotransporter protein
MLNKSIAFGLLAAGLMIAPTAAFAGQNQSVDQYTEQNGAAVNGSSTVQTSTTNSSQVQNARTNRPTPRYGHGYGHGYGRSGKVNQDQKARQTTGQNGAATDGSYTDQDSRTRNNQRQNAR